MRRVTKLYLDGIAITKLPTSVGNLSGLDSLNLRDCKNLMSLPSTFFNMTWLKDLNLSGCSKLEENLGRGESVKVNGQMASSNAIFKTLKKKKLLVDFSFSLLIQCREVPNPRACYRLLYLVCLL